MNPKNTPNRAKQQTLREKMLNDQLKSSKVCQVDSWNGTLLPWLTK